MSSFEAKIVEDSVSPAGVRLTTMQLVYPRYIHAEVLTHRVFSRNASSSRAVPVNKAVDLALSEMVKPIRFGKNQPGMQAGEEDLEGLDLKRAEQIWEDMARVCADGAKKLAALGLHKQWANRPTEWFGRIRVVITATEWSNFFELRDHPDAQPEIRELARIMRVAMGDSDPVIRGLDPNLSANWHLPYVTPDERVSGMRPGILAKLSAARCARVSYLTHDGKAPDRQKDVELYERLVGSHPMHASPVEHQAYPMNYDGWCKNFRGWFQFRALVERGDLNL